jgi:hypothetical protein
MSHRPEPQLSVLNFLASSDLARACEDLVAWGYHVVRLDGQGVSDQQSLLAQATKDLPGVDAARPVNWSGLSDGLTDLVFDLEVPKIALMWTSAHRMLEGGLPDLMVAADILAGASRMAYGEDILFLTFLAGDGPNFPSWPDKDTPAPEG